MLINILGLIGVLLIVYTILRIKTQDKERKKELEELKIIYSIGLKEYKKSVKKNILQSQNLTTRLNPISN